MIYYHSIDTTTYCAQELPEPGVVTLTATGRYSQGPGKVVMGVRLGWFGVEAPVLVAARRA